VFFLFLSGLFLGSMEQTLAERFGEIERERENKRASEQVRFCPYCHVSKQQYHTRTHKTLAGIFRYGQMDDLRPADGLALGSGLNSDFGENNHRPCILGWIVNRGT